MNKVLPFELSGNTKSSTLIILLHGFPDNIRIWDSLIKEVAPENAQFLSISYPNYHKAETLKFGQDLPTIVNRIKQTVDFVDQGRNQKKIFVTHDWGAILGYILDKKYPKYMDDMIALDIGGHIGNLKTNWLIFLVLYQLFFALTFIIGLIPIIGPKIGNFLSIGALKLMGMSKSIPESYNCSMNYFYFYQWANVLKSTFKRDPSLNYLHNYEPSVPIVFIYGLKKPFMFHSLRWQKILAKNQNSQYISTQGDHWVMRDSLALLAEKLRERIKRQS